MTPEEHERTTDFILRQQAQFAVDLQNLGGHVQTLTGHVQTLTGHLLELTTVVQQEHEQRMEDIARFEGAVVKLEQLIEIQSRRLDRLERDLPS